MFLQKLFPFIQEKTKAEQDSPKKSVTFRKRGKAEGVISPNKSETQMSRSFSQEYLLMAIPPPQFELGCYFCGLEFQKVNFYKDSLDVSMTANTNHPVLDMSRKSIIEPLEDTEIHQLSTEVNREILMAIENTILAFPIENCTIDKDEYRTRLMTVDTVADRGSPDQALEIPSSSLPMYDSKLTEEFYFRRVQASKSMVEVKPVAVISNPIESEVEEFKRDIKSEEKMLTYEGDANSMDYYLEPAQIGRDKNQASKNRPTLVESEIEAANLRGIDVGCQTDDEQKHLKESIEKLKEDERLAQKDVIEQSEQMKHNEKFEDRNEKQLMEKPDLKISNKNIKWDEQIEQKSLGSRFSEPKTPELANTKEIPLDILGPLIPEKRSHSDKKNSSSQISSHIPPVNELKPKEKDYANKFRPMPDTLFKSDNKPFQHTRITSEASDLISPFSATFKTVKPKIYDNRKFDDGLLVGGSIYAVETIEGPQSLSRLLKLSGDTYQKLFTAPEVILETKQVNGKICCVCPNSVILYDPISRKASGLSRDHNRKCWLGQEKVDWTWSGSRLVSDPNGKAIYWASWPDMIRICQVSNRKLSDEDKIIRIKYKGFLKVNSGLIKIFTTFSSANDTFFLLLTSANSAEKQLVIRNLNIESSETRILLNSSSLYLHKSTPISK